MNKTVLHLLIISILTISTISQSKETNIYSIHAEINSLSMNDLILDSDLMPITPPLKIGFKINASDKVGLEFFSGFFYNSGNEEDEISNTSFRHGKRIFSMELAMFYKTYKDESSALSIYSGYGLNIQKWNSGVYTSSSDDSDEYNVFIHSFFIGVEPEYMFFYNFSIFSRFALSLNLIPNSKYLEFDGSTNSYTKRLLERNNSKTVITTNGISLGIRYHF